MPGSERSTDIVNDSCSAQMQFTNYYAFKEGCLIQLGGIPLILQTCIMKNRPYRSRMDMTMLKVYKSANACKIRKNIAPLAKHAHVHSCLYLFPFVKIVQRTN